MLHASSHVPASVHLTKHAHVGRRATCTALYSYPSPASSVPVLQDVLFRWDNTCYNFTEIDLYLSVQTLASGLVPVHVWTQIDFGVGATEVRLDPTWWNASSSGGDSVSAQLGMTASGSPLWNTAAPSSSAFKITNIYSTSYTNAPATIAAANDSSTASSGHPDSMDEGLTGARLAAAVATPLVALMIVVCAYLAWHKFYRKRGDKKRWSAVIDKRVSMMSEGTWQPSVSIISRPESHIRRSRQSTSTYVNLEGTQRGSIIRPSSTYSGEHVSPPRRQVDRSSRISFASIPDLSRRDTSDKLPGQHHQHGRTRSDVGPLCSRRDHMKLSSSPSEGALNPRPTRTSAYKSSLRHEVLLSDPAKVEPSDVDLPHTCSVRSPAEDLAHSISSDIQPTRRRFQQTGMPCSC